MFSYYRIQQWVNKALKKNNNSKLQGPNGFIVCVHTHAINGCRYEPSEDSFFPLIVFSLSNVFPYSDSYDAYWVLFKAIFYYIKILTIYSGIGKGGGGGGETQSKEVITYSHLHH